MRHSSRFLVAIAAIVALSIGLATWIGATHWFEQRALGQARDDALRTARQQVRLFDSDLARFRLLPIVLGEYTDLGRALDRRDSPASRRMDGKLALLARRTGAPVIYLIDRDGHTVSASNAGTAESFVGRNYRFRPYFVRAMKEGAAEYYAVGNVSGRPGLFLSRRIGSAERPDGVIVVKVEFETLTRAWRTDPGVTLTIDGRRIVLFATDPAERFRTMAPLSADLRAAIARSAQFGTAPLLPSRYRLTGSDTARGPNGARLIVSGLPMPVPGWRLLHAVPAAPALRTAANLARLTAVVVTLLAAAIILAMLWRATRAATAARDRAALEAAIAERTGELRDEMAERARIDRRFREAREELAQANRLGSLGSITAGLAHEINQPVATIRTLAENARHHLANGRLDRVAANLDTSIALTARIGSITQEMRRFARRGTGVIGPVPLDAVIEGARLLMNDRFRTAQVRLDLPPPGQPSVVAGRVRLEQVAVNLLQNALDAVAGRDDPRVALTIDADAHQVRLTVADNGAGIDPALGDSIFLPFVTGKAEGLGLGLGIVRDIVGEFGGTVAVVASPSGGAAFRVTLVRAGEGE